MADSRDDPAIYFVDPEERGVIPLDGLRVSRSLKKVVRSGVFKVTYDQAFSGVVDECAAFTQDRPETWINDGIKFLYGELFESGHAHSVEVWSDEKLVGGLYGVSIASAFFGESMFSRVSNASKVALVYLVERLNPEKSFTGSAATPFPSVVSSKIWRNANVSGMSSGGFFSQCLTSTVKDP